MPRASLLLALLAPFSFAFACADGEERSATPEEKPPDVEPLDFAAIEKSCAYDCPVTTCAERTAPYACQNLDAWKRVPHAESCGTWDGKHPKVTTGKCSASAPSGDAAKYAGADGDRTILPDGRRLSPSASEWIFQEPDLQGGITTGLAPVPGTTLALAVDTGTGKHVVRLLDTKLIGSGDPVRSRVAFEGDVTLGSGIAVAGPNRVYVPSSTGKVFLLALDAQGGTLKQDDAGAVALPAVTKKQQQPDGWYASSVAASPDGKRLVVGSVFEPTLLVYDIDPTSATAGTLLGQVALGATDVFGVYFDPQDTAGTLAYVSLWGGARVLEVDLTDPKAPEVKRSFPTPKDPQGIVFLDGRWMVASGDLGDALAVIDRNSGTVTNLPVDTSSDLKGVEPAVLTYSAKDQRLYVALAGINAIGAYDVDLTSEPPKISPAGRLPTSWWPSGVLISDSGEVVVANMRGRGTGPNAKHLDIGDGEISSLIRGSVQKFPPPDAASLALGEQTVHENNAVSTRSGRPTLSCPSGVSDFPVPESIGAPSPVIEHVFFILRENKNFDALFGDLPGVNGDPKLTLKASASDMDVIWRNLRDLARTFTVSDNYYTAAVQSTQGHVWATYGRTNDFNERTWALDARPVPGGGVFDVGRPEEGSLFEWLGKNAVPYDILGEIVGSPKTAPPPNPVDGKYPGGPFQNIGYNDLEKACYVAGRVRVLCNIRELAYITLPNDHTFGVSPENPTPETFCAVNDEATGMVVDAVSHSPIWKSSLIIIVEDDPLQGGEHVDSHRTPFVMVSPWVKRGYVSKTHISTSSIHKLYAHIFGKPYPNRQVEEAMLPLDAFTSTPDYTPYEYTPRSWPLACGDGASRYEILMTESWDFDEVDEQPGLGAQVVRWMRGRQLERMSPEEEERVRARIRRKLSLEAQEDD